VQSASDGRDPSGQVVRALLLFRADPAARTAKRDLPLHYAAGGGLHEVYAALLEAMAEAAGGDHAAARRIEREATNDWGQAPREMLKNRLICQGLREEQAASQDAEMLLRVGFFAFQHSRMVSRLRLWQNDQAVHLFEVLHQRWSFFTGGMSLENFHSRSNSSASSSDSEGYNSGSPSRTLARQRIRKRAAVKVLPLHKHGAATRENWSAATNLKQVLIASKMKSRFRSAAASPEAPGKAEDAGRA